MNIWIVIYIKDMKRIKIGFNEDKSEYVEIAKGRRDKKKELEKVGYTSYKV